ncbi:MAG: hypothetical protein ACTSXZ_05610 [Alphaproteobacteria bacterium]
MRLIPALLTAIVLFVLLDLGVLWLEAKPDLVLRNEASTHFATPYFLRQIEKTKDRPVVAFFGASVINGTLNTTPETAMPVVVQKLLAEQGVDARCFNLAAIANNLGDNLALATEAAYRGADLLVFNLHYRLFSGKGSLGRMTCHRDTVFYLRDRIDFRILRRRHLFVSDRDYLEISLRHMIKSYWAFYREVRLLTYLLTGDLEPLPAQFRKWLLGVEREEKLTPAALVGSPEERNRDNLWYEQPASYHLETIETFKEVVLDPENKHFQMLELLNELSTDFHVKVMFYLTPVCRAAVDKFGYFDWEQYAEFARMTREMTEENNNIFIDATDAAESRHFTDCDHLNISGHRQLAEALVGPIAETLQGVKP